MASLYISESMADAIKDSLSPEAVVAIAAHLQSARVRDEKVNAEIGFFHDFLFSLIGVDQYNRIVDEIGV